MSVGVNNNNPFQNLNSSKANKAGKAGQINKNNKINKNINPQQAQQTPPGNFGANFNSANKSKGVVA